MRTMLALALAFAVSAPAFDATAPTFLGSWNIVSSMVAPWAPPNDTLGLPDVPKLVGKQLVFGQRGIVAPVEYMNCAGAHYEMKDYPAEGLFQGSLPDADKTAAALGFHPPKIRTLETGCAFDFHFIDDNTAMFALDNRLYRLERVRR